MDTQAGKEKGKGNAGCLHHQNDRKDGRETSHRNHPAKESPEHRPGSAAVSKQARQGEIAEQAGDQMLDDLEDPVLLYIPCAPVSPLVGPDWPLHGEGWRDCGCC